MMQQLIPVTDFLTLPLLWSSFAAAKTISYMNNQQAYNTWAGNYDTVINRTRDVEARALRAVLSELSFSQVLETGCGTGKNTEWFAEKAASVTCLDFSEEMLQQARQKITAGHVHFQQADIRIPWQVPAGHFDLVSTSLVP